jgi:hypothetical protein
VTLCFAFLSVAKVAKAVLQASENLKVPLAFWY